MVLDKESNEVVNSTCEFPIIIMKCVNWVAYE